MARQTRKKSVPPREYDQITVVIPMLDSLNRKYGTTGPRDGRRMYIRAAYRKAAKKALSSLVEQLAIVNQDRAARGETLWLPQDTDRYTIAYSFDFLDELRQDEDNPLKATKDLLQKAGILKNDNRVFQTTLVKNPNIMYPMASITIYKFHKLYYQPAPLQDMYESWLAQEYAHEATPILVPERTPIHV